MRRYIPLIIYTGIVIVLFIVLLIANTVSAQEYIPYEITSDLDPEHQWEVLFCAPSKQKLIASGINPTKAIHVTGRGWCVSSGVGSQFDFFDEVTKAIQLGIHVIFQSEEWKNSHGEWQQGAVSAGGIRHYPTKSEVEPKERPDDDIVSLDIMGLAEDLYEAVIAGDFPLEIQEDYGD